MKMSRIPQQCCLVINCNIYTYYILNNLFFNFGTNHEFNLASIRPAVEALQTHVKSEVGGVAEKVNMMDNDDQATQEQPIGFYEKQENLTKTDESNDDEEQDLATMLPHDQQ